MLCYKYVVNSTNLQEDLEDIWHEKSLKMRMLNYRQSYAIVKESQRRRRLIHEECIDQNQSLE